MAIAVFFVAAAVAVLGGIGVVAFHQPIRSVLSLVLVMLALSVIFLLLSAQFVFAVQIIVYAGAVMVLFLFVIALLGPARDLARGRVRDRLPAERRQPRAGRLRPPPAAHRWPAIRAYVDDGRRRGGRGRAGDPGRQLPGA